MTASALLDVLDEIGVTLRIEEGDLVIAPRSAISPPLAEAIKKRKSEIFGILKGNKRASNEAEPTDHHSMNGLVRSLGRRVQTPVGIGKLMYLTLNGAVVQVNSGLLYTLNPLEVSEFEN